MWPSKRWNLDATPKSKETPKASAEDNGKIGEFVRHLLVRVETTRKCYHPRTHEYGDFGVGLSYHQIVSLVWARFPGCKTSVQSVQWYASKMKKEGMTLPLRPRH
jgi:hypothetical protein